MTTMQQEITKNLNLTIKPQEEMSVFEFSNPSTKSDTASTEIILKPDSKLTYVFALFGADKIEKNIHFKLEKGAELNVYGIFFNDQKQHHKIRTLVEHEGEHSKSKVEVKGLLKDRSFNKFQGIIKINKTAVESTGELEQRVLLLNKTALAEGQPELEILNNNVKASHAATIGKINEEQLFYMTSRGINPKKAKEMIINGFLKDLISAINEEQIQMQVESFLQEKIIKK